ncbi:MAG TPA: VanZ family protein [Pyrinomonadaceae bacterium]
MSKTTQRVKRYLPLVVWITVISIASTSEFSGANTSRIIRPLVLWLFPETSEATLQTIHFVVRKLAHFTEYAILGFLAARAFSTSSLRTLKRRWFPIALFLIVIYALLDEYHQSFVPSRTASIYDSMIDSIGGVAGLLIYARRRKEP